MKIRFRIPNMLSMLFVLSFLASRLIFWTNGTWQGYYGFYSMSPSVGSLDQLLLAGSAILGVLVSLYGFVRIIQRQGSVVGLLAAVGLFFCFCVWLLDFLDNNSLTLLFVGNFTPLYLLFIGCLFLGYDENYILFFSKVSKVLAGICLLMAAFFTIEFYVSYAGLGVRFGNSHIMTFFQYGFYFTTFYVFTNKDMRYDEKKSHMLMLSLIALIIAVCSVSRGWILQAVILVLYVMFGKERGNRPNYSKRIQRIVIGAIIISLVFMLLVEYAPTILGTLGERIFEDTRSTQLEEFFSQLTPSSAITGQGYDATYRESAHGIYSYIDNQVLMMIFRYGILPTIVYFGVLIYAVIVSFKTRKHGGGYWVAILMWLLALNGLAIYLSLNIDIQNYITLLLCGRGIACSKSQRKNCSYAYVLE